jgi:hypothetical protein
MKRSPDTLAAIGLVLSMAASCVLFVLLVQVDGPGVVMVLLLPVILSALGLSTSKGLRVFAGLMLLALALTTAMGPYYMPGALLLLAAAHQTVREDVGALTITISAANRKIQS